MTGEVIREKVYEDKNEEGDNWGSKKPLDFDSTRCHEDQKAPVENASMRMMMPLVLPKNLNDKERFLLLKVDGLERQLDKRAKEEGYFEEDGLDELVVGCMTLEEFTELHEKLPMLKCKLWLLDDGRVLVCGLPSLAHESCAGFLSPSLANQLVVFGLCAGDHYFISGISFTCSPLTHCLKLVMNKYNMSIEILYILYQTPSNPNLLGEGGGGNK